jgi:hypothetical protein
MRKYIIAAFLLLGTGIGISLILIPSKEEIAAGPTTAPAAQALDVSTMDVEAAYAGGDRRFAVVAAFADKKIAGGDRPGAIAILEAYVNATPNDAQGRKKLAEQYQLAGNRAAYLQQLEAIAAATPTEETLRVLSDIYNSDKEYAKQQGVLVKLLEVSGGNTPEVYVDLATIQSLLGDNAGAFATVQALQQKHPAFQSFASTRIWVINHAEHGEGEAAQTKAEQWIAAASAQMADPAIAKSKAAELAELVDILHYRGHADKAVALADRFSDLRATDARLLAAYVRANVTMGASARAYDVMQEHYSKGTLPPALVPTYLGTLIDREDETATAGVIAQFDVATLSELEALEAMDVLRDRGAASHAKALSARLSQTANLATMPVLSALLALVDNDKDQDAKIEAALAKPLSTEQRGHLAQACARAKKQDCFAAIVALYPPVAEQTPAQIAELAQLHILADRADAMVDSVGAQAGLANASALVTLAHRRLAAAAGRGDVLDPWLAREGAKAPLRDLQELFYLANDRGHRALASTLAEALYLRDASPTNRDIMITALVASDQHAKALPLLREQVTNHGAADGLYLATLSKLARKDAEARTELGDYAALALREGRGDNRQQLNYAFILINQGRKDVVMPYARTYSSERGGEWQKMYAQLTRKDTGSGKPAAKATREELVAMAANPTATATTKRQVAFELLNQGYKADAMPLFLQLAKDKGPGSQEVKDLMYLWGGKLNAEQLAWVQSRAASAPAYDRQGWAELVNQNADDQALIGFVSATPDALYNPDLRKKYFRVLAATGSRAYYEQAMRDWVAQTTDVPALMDYASAGQSAGYREAAIAAYERILTLDPNNTQALNQLGALNFSKGKFASARDSLARSAATPAADGVAQAESHFYRAELMRREGNTQAAMQEYQQVVAATSQSGASAPDALSRLYTAQFRLGQHADAKAGFSQLLAQHPDNKAILADYMSILIEYNYLDEATAIANQYDKSSPYFGQGAALQGRSAHVSRVERFSDGREMKLSYAEPVDGASPLAATSVANAPWLEKTRTDYDSTTISARPGYVLHYSPTSNDQFAVVAAQQPVEYAPQVELQRQQELRLQLLYARIESQSGQLQKARERVEALKYYYPNDPQLLSTEAALASASGDRSQAIALLDQARAAAPENEDLSLQAQNIRRTGLGSHVKLDYEFRRLGDNDEHIGTASGAIFLGGGAEIGFTAQQNRFDLKDYYPAKTGLLSTIEGANRHRGELYAAKTASNGNRAKASIFYNNEEIGGGLTYAFDNPIGRTEVIGEYHRPYWDFIAAVYEDATRDRVGFKHFTALQPGTTLGIESSYNNYNISAEDDVAQTALLRANLVQELQPETAAQPYLGVGYGFDGEYRMDKPEGRVTAGRFNYLLPVQTREVHALTGIYRDHWTPETEVLFIGGAAYDRIRGAFSPLAEGRIDHDITDALQVGARARYAIESNNTDNEALNLGADVLYKF